MSSDQPKSEPPAPPVAKPKGALKDRIADLQIARRASALGGSLAQSVKAVQAAAPSRADLADKVKAAAGAVRIDKLNRESLKAGRDGLAAKVEALLKPRAVDEPPAPAPARQPASDGNAATSRPRPDLAQLKSRLDDALKPRTPPQTQSQTPLALPGPPPEPAGTAVAVVPAAPEPVAPTAGASATDRIRSSMSRLISRRASPPDAPPTTADVAATEPATVVVTQRSHTVRTTAAQAEARRPIFSLGLLATAVTAAGVLHIVTTFAIPASNMGSAFDRLKWQLEPNVMRIMPFDATGQTPLPFLSADMRYAMCRYDVSQNSVQISAVLPDLGWSLALYTQQGDNFYAVPGQDGRSVTSTFVLNLASDRLLLPVPGVRRADTDATQVTSPQREGLVVIRAPIKGPAYLPAVEQALKVASCRVVTRR